MYACMSVCVCSRMQQIFCPDFQAFKQLRDVHLSSFMAKAKQTKRKGERKLFRVDFFGP